MHGKYRRLKVELLLSILASFLMVTVVYAISEYALSYYMTEILENGSYTRKKESLSVNKIQEMIRTEHLSINQFPTLEKELDKEHIWFWAISSEQQELDAFHDENARKYFLTSYQYNTYTVTFSDGVAKLHIISDYENIVFYNAQILILILCFLVFIITFLNIISRKIKYLNCISEEIRVIEGGELDSPITVKGKDELTELSENLNRMRLALKQKIELEKEAREANRDLITMLSHDLRTPLTSQLGYLEILKTHQFETKEQYFEYLEKCIANCEQIHHMSDRIFEYFLVSEKTNRELAVEMTGLDGRELLSQMILEKCLLLEEQGYQFQLILPEEALELSLNIDYMFRIIENIFSNIEKYAEMSKPILFSLRKEGQECVFQQSNHIRENQSSMESTKIGLRSVEQMTNRQNGTMQTTIQKSLFCLTLRFPLTECVVKTMKCTT